MMKALSEHPTLRHLLLLAGLSLFSILPTILVGVNNSSSQHFQFAATYEESLNSGVMFPSWAADENLGYGSVGVRFYPPLFSFLLGLAQAITGSWLYSIAIIFFLSSVIGACGIYFLSKEFLNPPHAVWAASVFIFLPFRLFEIHNNSLFSEFLGGSVLTFSFLFITRVCRNRGWMSVLALAISVALLILTHLPLTVIGGISLAVYAMISLRGIVNPSMTLLKLSVGVLGGLLASAFYWLRMFLELDWLRNAKFWHDQHFEYTNHFLLMPPRVAGLSFLNLILLTLISIVACSLVGYFVDKKRGRNETFTAVLALLFLSIFMTVPLSYPIWALLPYLSEVQFPWRWLTILCLVSPIVIAGGMNRFLRHLKSVTSWRSPAYVIAAMAIVLTAITYYKATQKFTLEAVPAGKVNIWAEETSKAMGFEFWWTVNTKSEAFLIDEKIVAQGRPYEIVSWQPTERIFKVEAGNRVEARIATLYYPHWKAAINNRPTELSLADDGTINVAIPADPSIVRVWFQEPSIIRISYCVSLFMWIGFLLLPCVILIYPRISKVFSPYNVLS
jgi:hypothetical protein